MIVRRRPFVRILQALMLLAGVATMTATSTPRCGGYWTQLALRGCELDRTDGDPFCRTPLPGAEVLLEILDRVGHVEEWTDPPTATIGEDRPSEIRQWRDLSLSVSRNESWLDLWRRLRGPALDAPLPEGVEVTARQSVACPSEDNTGVLHGQWTVPTPAARPDLAGLVYGRGDLAWRLGHGGQVESTTIWDVRSPELDFVPLELEGFEREAGQSFWLQPGADGATLWVTSPAGTQIIHLPWWLAEEPTLLVDRPERWSVRQAMATPGLAAILHDDGRLVLHVPALDEPEVQIAENLGADARLLALDRSVWLWTSIENGEYRLRRLPDGPVYAVPATTDGPPIAHLALGGSDASPRLHRWRWSPEAGGVLETFEPSDNGIFMRLVLSGAGPALMITESEPVVFNHPTLRRGPPGGMVFRLGPAFLWPTEETMLLYDLDDRRDLGEERDDTTCCY